MHAPTHNPTLAAVPPTHPRLLQAWATLLVLTLWWDFSGADLAIMQAIGHPDGFAWRHHWLLEAVLHDGLRRVAFGFLALLGLWALWPAGPGGVWPGVARRERGVVVVLVLLSVLAVNLVKSSSRTSCPWELQLFGGQASYVSHWNLWAGDGGGGRCFPGGHASSAFAFLALCLPWLAPRTALDGGGPASGGGAVAVIAAVPVHETLHAQLQFGVGPHTEALFERGGVGPGFGHVALLHGQETLDGLDAGGLFDAADEVQQAHRRAVAHVEHAVRRRARAGHRGDGHHLDHRVDHVVHIGEVAAHLAVVVDVDRLVGQDGAHELEDRHVEPAPGAVHREQPQRRGRDLVEVGGAVGHQLVGLLARGVERDRLVGDLVLAQRHLARGAG